MTLTCRNCGYQLDAQGSKCPECGKPYSRGITSSYTTAARRVSERFYFWAGTLLFGLSYLLELRVIVARGHGAGRLYHFMLGAWDMIRGRDGLDGAAVLLVLLLIVSPIFAAVGALGPRRWWPLCMSLGIGAGVAAFVVALAMSQAPGLVLTSGVLYLLAAIGAGLAARGHGMARFEGRWLVRAAD